jgi:hypothetical protein
MKVFLLLFFQKKKRLLYFLARRIACRFNVRPKMIAQIYAACRGAMVVATLVSLHAVAANGAEMPNGTRYMSLQDYQQAPEDTARMYVHGIVEGFTAMNSQLRRDGRPTFYCNPPDTPMTTDDEVGLLNQYISQASPPPDAPVGSVMLHAMEQNFPCD